MADRNIDRARKLRREMTMPERLLWSQLRGGRLFGLKFRRQHPVAGYVVDFYCEQHRLAVEVDGVSHVGRVAYDRGRQAEIEAEGIRFVRVSNDDVLKHMDSVLTVIARACGVDVT